jgi:ACS family D-galactonate transporter-like MFS transporter
MSVSAARPVGDGANRGFMSTLWSRQLDSYPDTAARVGYLALVVVITTALYYELYVGGSVASLQLAALHMSFSFYVVVLAFGNLIGAFGSLVAGLADRVGRTNLVVVGLFITGVMVAFVIPEATTKWAFGIEYFVVGLVEGICLVATPALIRDFSPQVGRGVAMGFWTMGPVLGSLVVAAVGSATISSSTTWPHEYRICGYVGLVVFVLAAIFARELSPGLRDQLMVTTRDRMLIEARAKGLDIEASLKHPFRQLLKVDIVMSALGVSLLLLVYYTAVAFGTVYFETVFGFTLNQANRLGDWNWGVNAVSLIVIGVASDRFRVRKPFMVIGAVFGAVMMVLYLSQAGHHVTFFHLALLVSLLSVGLGFAYTPWMASFTETVESRNPALTATGLAIWGWILRVVVFVAFLILPQVITTVNPLVDYGGTVAADAAEYPALTFAGSHPQLVAFATKNAATLDFAATHPTLVAAASKDSAQLGTLAKFAPEIKVISSNPTLFKQLAADPSSKAVQGKIVQAAGGGATGVKVLQTIAANGPAINQAIAFATANPTVVAGAEQYASQLTTLATLSKTQSTLLSQASQYSAQLAELAKVPPSVAAFMAAHASAVVAAKAKAPNEWKHWYWICFGGIIFFLLAIPLLKGRWSPSAAKADEDAHEAMVAEELAKLRS